MTYLLSKLLPLALLPLGLSLILLLMGLIGRWRWPVIAALVLLWVCSLGLECQDPLAEGLASTEALFREQLVQQLVRL